MHSLKSSLKVKAIIRSAQSSNLFATILRSGDKDNGIILLKLRRKDNKSILLGKVLTVDGFYKWNDLFYNENNWIDEIDGYEMACKVLICFLFSPEQGLLHTV